MRREVFETGGPVKLDVRVPAGAVEIETHPGTTTELELDVAGDADAGRELLERATIEHREGQDEVVVHVRDRGRGVFGLFRNLDVRVAVRAPVGSSVKFETASADLRARGTLGSLDATTASGDAEVEELTAELEVSTASGDVDVRSVGGPARVNTASGDVELGVVRRPVSVKSASGDVTIESAETDVEIRTASGDQRVAAVTAGCVDLQSMSGDITVGVRRGSNVWVDGRAMSGELTSELELGDEAPPDDGAPLVELRATTMSGDVHLGRA